MLKGTQWFSWEIAPVIQAANALACKRFTDNLDLETPPDDQAVWRKACSDTTAMLFEVNKQADVDQAAAKAPSYSEISSLWQRVENTLAPFEGEPSIVAMVSALPRAEFSIPGPTWIAPALAVGGLAGVIALGYLWVRK